MSQNKINIVYNEPLQICNIRINSTTFFKENKLSVPVYEIKFDKNCFHVCCRALQHHSNPSKIRVYVLLLNLEVNEGYAPPKYGAPQDHIFRFHEKQLSKAESIFVEYIKHGRFFVRDALAFLKESLDSSDTVHKSQTVSFFKTHSRSFPGCLKTVRLSKKTTVHQNKEITQNSKTRYKKQACIRNSRNIVQFERK